MNIECPIRKMVVGNSCWIKYCTNYLPTSWCLRDSCNWFCHLTDRCFVWLYRSILIRKAGICSVDVKERKEDGKATFKAAAKSGARSINTLSKVQKFDIVTPGNFVSLEKYRCQSSRSCQHLPLRLKTVHWTLFSSVLVDKDGKTIHLSFILFNQCGHVSDIRTFLWMWLAYFCLLFPNPWQYLALCHFGRAPIHAAAMRPDLDALTAAVEYGRANIDLPDSVWFSIPMSCFQSCQSSQTLIRVSWTPQHSVNWVRPALHDFKQGLIM